MKVVSTEQMRLLDRKAIEEFEIPGEELMARAGHGVADRVMHLADRAGYRDPVVHLFAGRGNNGGDAFAAARYLYEQEYEVELWLAGSVDEIRGDALRHLSRMRAAGVTLRELPTLEDWEGALHGYEGCDILVDGVLGIGVKGPARGPVAGAIHCINVLGADALVLAIDVPSGLDADTGLAPGETVKADITVTVGLPKIGLLRPCAIDYVGNLEVVDIGIVPEMLTAAPADLELITPWDLRANFPRRSRQAHKGTFGHVLIIAGAVGYAGAAMMAIRAALRSGVGLVSALVPRRITDSVAIAVPEAMIHPAPDTEAGAMRGDALAGWHRKLDEFSAIVLGPGLTPGDDTRALVRTVLEQSRVPVVLDADALNVLAGHMTWLQTAQCPVVLTPHPGELARLAGCKVEEVQADRHAQARRMAAATRATVVLKGAGTVVAQDGQPLWINLTGNPGMATGGTGDVLAGLLGGFLAQRMPPLAAAQSAVYLHGRAGDYAAWRKSQYPISTWDLIEELPFVFREVTAR